MRAVAVPGSFTRAVTPTATTAIAATSAMTTIFRCVERSAVSREWFTGRLPKSLSFVAATEEKVERFLRINPPHHHTARFEAPAPSRCNTWSGAVTYCPGAEFRPHAAVR